MISTLLLIAGLTLSAFALTCDRSPGSPPTGIVLATAGVLICVAVLVYDWRNDEATSNQRSVPGALLVGDRRTGTIMVSAPDMAFSRADLPLLLASSQRRSSEPTPATGRPLSRLCAVVAPLLEQHGSRYRALDVPKPPWRRLGLPSVPVSPCSPSSGAFCGATGDMLVNDRNVFMARLVGSELRNTAGAGDGRDGGDEPRRVSSDRAAGGASKNRPSEAVFVRVVDGAVPVLEAILGAAYVGHCVSFGVIGGRVHNIDTHGPVVKSMDTPAQPEPT